MSHKSKLDALLGPNGLLSRSMPGYEHRKQQVRMASGVFEALQAEDRLIIEAPTGTGKTLAYLVAAVLSRKRVAISTGTKNLQEQLFFKDIPFLREKVFPELKAALLKGRGNFVCHARLHRFLRQPQFRGMTPTSVMEEILQWYQETRETGSGDRAELWNLPDDDTVWPEICSSSDTCLGRKCPDRDDCFVLKMKSKAAESDLLIVNHHLLASDLAVRDAGFGEVIPRYEALIVDEAHGLEDAITQHFGFHVSQSRILRLVRDARVELDEAGADRNKFEKMLPALEDNTRRLFKQCQEVFGNRSLAGPIQPDLAEVRDTLCANLELLIAMVSGLPKATDELNSVARRADEASQALATILTDDPGGDYACWAERRDKNLILHASPVEVGELLQKSLYEKVRSIVFTSATLSSGGQFEYFKSRLGLNEDKDIRESILDSPFDYKSQTMLYIPRSMPEPNSPGFTDALAEALQEILLRTQGRAFVLFTSYKNMDAVYANMKGRLPFPLLVQGSRPRSRLLEEFRERSGSVLFATSSFWEGVDVQGEALSCVVVDRLPFAPPDDPLVSCRMERIRQKNGNPFYSFQVPMAVLALKQGLGRLIRTGSDRGILCILDIRILTKPYGKVFRQSLHESPLCRNPEEIEEFFCHGDMEQSQH
jgi:ATP-dependent DNA helicase DinG